ncbi:BTB/POZ domain and ankyrin repeat-containing protein NPR1 [Linum perenne]
MDIANADTTPEFAGLAAPKGSSGNLREVDLNETPVMQKRRLLSRLEALKKTGNQKLLYISSICDLSAAILCFLLGCFFHEQVTEF